MSTKKRATNAAKEKTTFNKIAETIGQVAGEIVVGKDRLVEKATGTINSVKARIHDLTASNEALPVKAKAVKKAAKKVVKKVAKKVVKPAPRKISKVVPAKKVNAAKKVVKKVAKKAAKPVLKKKR